MKPSHLICRVVRFRHEGGTVLRVGFDDGTEQSVDLGPILRGELFGPLQDPGVFGTVRLNEEAGTLQWSNGAELDPETLHDWPAHGSRLAEQLARAEAVVREEAAKKASARRK